MNSTSAHHELLREAVRTFQDFPCSKHHYTGCKMSSAGMPRCILIQKTSIYCWTAGQAGHVDSLSLILMSAVQARTVTDD